MIITRQNFNFNDINGFAEQLHENDTKYHSNGFIQKNFHVLKHNFEIFCIYLIFWVQVLHKFSADLQSKSNLKKFISYD